MNITVLGSQGMAGHVIAQYLEQQGYAVTRVDRSVLDITNSASVAQFFDNLQTNFVINCIGLLVQPCIDRPNDAVLINSWWPHMLEQQLSNTATRLIHLSTDCVFDGKQGNYVEQDRHSETNFYGRSKSLGEVDNSKDVTFRMSIIGPELKHGTGLFHWTVTNASNQLNGFKNHVWNGLTTLQLAKCIDSYMQHPTITGVYHLVNNQNQINKYDLLCMINQVFELEKTIVPVDSDKNVNKVLIDTRLENLCEIPSYDQQLVELRSWIDQHSCAYDSTYGQFLRH